MFRNYSKLADLAPLNAEIHSVIVRTRTDVGTSSIAHARSASHLAKDCHAGCVLPWNEDGEPQARAVIGLDFFDCRHESRSRLSKV